MSDTSPLRGAKRGGVAAQPGRGVGNAGADAWRASLVRVIELIATDRLLLPVLVTAAAAAVSALGRSDQRARRALADFTASYQVRAGRSVWRLEFARGWARPRRGSTVAPDFEIRFVDLRGALQHLARDPHDMIGLVMTGKIDQRGNLYYLFKLGYLFALLRSSADELARRWQGRSS